MQRIIEGKPGTKITVGDAVIQIVCVRSGGVVKIGVDAPREMTIARKELTDALPALQGRTVSK